MRREGAAWIVRFVVRTCGIVVDFWLRFRVGSIVDGNARCCWGRRLSDVAVQFGFLERKCANESANYINFAVERDSEDAWLTA